MTFFPQNVPTYKDRIAGEVFNATLYIQQVCLPEYINFLAYCLQIYVRKLVAIK